MTVHQLPAESGAFARYLRDLTSLLDPGGGWYGVFRQRDPDGLRACFDGVEIPPWDVVASLLQDFAAGRDPRLAEAETARARRLHTASAAAHDRQPGGGEALAERLRLMLREQAYAGERVEELLRSLRTTPESAPEARQLGLDLAWVRDDHARASARCDELRSRLAALTPPGPAAPRPGPPDSWFRAEESFADDESVFGGHDPAPAPRETAAPADDPGLRDTGTRASPPGAEERPDESGTSASKRGKRDAASRRKPRGARFAGLDLDEDVEEAVPAPVTAAPPPGARETPRGARFGGASAGRPRTPEPAHSAEDRRAAERMVASLIRLRREGRSGEAHVVLCEAAGRSPGRLPLLAAELHRAGLGADWAELLWEAASLPPAQLAAAAGALAVAGRDDDCGQLLRQGAARPADEIADAVLALGDAGRAHEARALLSAYVQTRRPEDAALVALPDPRRLVPQLLDAARAVSAGHERDVDHALRVAGIG